MSEILALVSPTVHPRTGFAFLDEPVEAGGVVAMAHRGGAPDPALLDLENTMKAFQSAVSLGYRYLETDVHSTRDGQLLAFHDRAFDRVTDRSGSVSDATHAEVAAILVGGTEPIPRLEDLLEAFPDARFNVDLKSPAAVEPMVDLVERTRAHHRLCVGSFEERAIRRFRARLAARSSIPVATSTGILAPTVLKLIPGGRHLQRLLRDDGAVFQVPHRRYGRTVVDERFVHRAHALGRHVHVWVINDRAEMGHLLDLGVDGIITDQTDVLRDVLVERGQWR